VRSLDGAQNQFTAASAVPIMFGVLLLIQGVVLIILAFRVRA
jgi:uncharacterized membrane protein HdeD (DUF308 family)